MNDSLRLLVFYLPDRVGERGVFPPVFGVWAARSKAGRRETTLKRRAGLGKYAACKWPPPQPVPGLARANHPAEYAIYAQVVTSKCR